MASRYNPNAGTPLTDADSTVDPTGDFANEYVAVASTLTAARIKTFDATSAEAKYVVRIIAESQAPGGDLIIKNTAGTTLYTFSAGFGGTRAISIHAIGGLYQLLSIYHVDPIDSATASLSGLLSASHFTKLAAMYRPKQGTALTNADQTLQPFTDKASEYVQTTALTANRVKTLGTTTVVEGTVVRIVREDTAAFTMEIVNGGGAGGTPFTFAASPTEKQAATFYYNGADWILVGFEYLAS
jgi:hypothetical protein